MNNMKMVIVMRNDLNMRKGKMIAQSGHGILSAFIKSDHISKYNWFNKDQKKICVYVKSEKELLDIYDNAITAKINSYLVEDLGLTEFNGQKTKTCLVIGPDYSLYIDPITKHLPLL